MKPQSTSSYDVDNRYRFYKSLNSKTDISPSRRGVRPGVDDNNSKNFLNDLKICYIKHSFPQRFNFHSENIAISVKIIILLLLMV